MLLPMCLVLLRCINLWLCGFAVTDIYTCQHYSYTRNIYVSSRVLTETARMTMQGRQRLRVAGQLRDNWCASLLLIRGMRSIAFRVSA